MMKWYFENTKIKTDSTNFIIPYTNHFIIIAHIVLYINTDIIIIIILHKSIFIYYK